MKGEQNLNKILKGLFLSVIVCIQFIMPSIKAQAAHTIYDNDIRSEERRVGKECRL